MSSPKEPDFSAKQSREIPDLYRLLSLAPLESNSEKIETRIARLRRKAEELQETNPRKAKHANKLAKVATAQLLSAEKKAAYDEIWARTYGRNEPKLTDDVLDQAGESLERVGTKSPTTTAAVECNAGTTALQDQAEPLTEAWQNFEGLLPSGSHSQAFDLPEYLENAHSSYDDAELDRLLEALTAQANGDETNPLDHHTASFEPAAPQPPFALNSNTPPKPLAKSLKSRRRRTWLGPLIGLFACLAMVMGLVAFLVGPGSQRSKDSESDDPLATAARRTNDAPLAPRRSGLPQVGGFGGPNGSGTRIALTPADGPTMPSETPFESSANESTDAMNAPYDSTSSGTTPPAKMPPDSPENTEPT
ncbi:MAG TPA: hypothetical protein DDW52_01735, partial [Planctomycetaceae bacterium]|nr:hypothetical protein [Planctomycetaceae bacterium]